MIFPIKKNLKKQTRKHHKYTYKVLIENKIPRHIAKYVKKLHLIERPTIKYKNQPEFTLNINSYTKKFISRVPSAKTFLKHNLKSFQQAEEKYNVDKEVIAALMLIESNLGKNKGKLKHSKCIIYNVPPLQ